jgi:hypothetical protein
LDGNGRGNDANVASQNLTSLLERCFSPDVVMACFLLAPTVCTEKSRLKPRSRASSFVYNPITSPGPLGAFPARSDHVPSLPASALRQQVIVLQRKCRGRVRLTNGDRLFFVQLYRWFPSILQAVQIVRPETLVRWHRAGFRGYWRLKFGIGEGARRSRQSCGR